jgi:proline iminopeptidase
MVTLRIALIALLAVPLMAETFKSHDGTVLHYDVIGRGTPVLLLSGGPGFSPDYLRPIAGRLAGKYRFILLHQRGTGKSTDASALQLPKLVADVEALRKELGVEKLILAGHSFGGILSMMYAREHPEHVGALALIDSGGPTLKSVVKFNTNLESRFTDDDKARIKEWTARAKDEKARAVLEITKAKTPAYFADRAKAKQLMDSMDENSFRDTVFWAIVPQMMALDIRAGLEKVKAPVVVIHGKQDPLETADEVHETFPGSRLELLDNAGHFPWLEQPERFYKVLDGFLAQVAESCH